MLVSERLWRKEQREKEMRQYIVKRKLSEIIGTFLVIKEYPQNYRS